MAAVSTKNKNHRSSSREVFHNQIIYRDGVREGDFTAIGVGTSSTIFSVSIVSCFHWLRKFVELKDSLFYAKHNWFHTHQREQSPPTSSTQETTDENGGVKKSDLVSWLLPSFLAAIPSATNGSRHQLHLWSYLFLREKIKAENDTVRSFCIGSWLTAKTISFFTAIF